MIPSIWAYRSLSLIGDYDNLPTPFGEEPIIEVPFYWMDKYPDRGGGDLTRHMAHFYRAVGKMRHVRTFAILLNGDFSGDIGQTKALLDRH